MLSSIQLMAFMQHLSNTMGWNHFLRSDTIRGTSSVKSLKLKPFDAVISIKRFFTEIMMITDNKTTNCLRFNIILKNVVFSEYLNFILNEIKIFPLERISTLRVRFYAIFFWTRHLYRCAYKLMCDLSRYMMYRCYYHFTFVKLSLDNTYAIMYLEFFFTVSVLYSIMARLQTTSPY